VALSDAAGELPFVHVKTRPGWSGFKQRPYPGDEQIEHITVPVARLDDVLPEDYTPTLIKIDVEGAELGTLRGAEQTLRNHRPVLLLEHGLGSADFYDTRPEQVHDFLTELGYRIFGLDGAGPLSLAEFVDCFERGTRVNFLVRGSAHAE
jgi:hypothetical protein